MYEIYFVLFSQIAVLYICFSQRESKHCAYNNGCGDADQINNTANISSNHSGKATEFEAPGLNPNGDTNFQFESRFTPKFYV